MMHRWRLVVFGVALFLVGCAAPGSSRSSSDGAPAGAGTSGSTLPWAAPTIDQAVKVLDGRTGEVVSFDDMLDRLAGADAVFLGETHIDETTHRVELAVYEGLLERLGPRVVLAMEMFERDVQPSLDAYLAGSIDEQAFLEQARAWGQYRTAYRPMIERARAGGHPVVASNIPRSLTRRISMEGLGVLDSLDVGERGYAPAEIHPNTPAYWRRVDNAIRGHLPMMRRGGADDQRLSSTQTLWDNTMGESCALALDAFPGAMVLHVNGAFHSQYWDGTARQFSIRKPDAEVLTVDVRSTRNPSVAGLGGEPVADFVVMAEARASDQNNGTWSVAFDRELKYRFHMPEGASEDTPAPLLIWFGEAGLTSQDGLDLWRERLGEHSAIVVIEPPYRGLQDDRSEGGRWFWADTFGEDIGAVIAATERAWAYLLRYHPIDPARVCVAGEGTGATVASALALFSERIDPAALVYEPAQYVQLKDFPLPLPDSESDAQRRASIAVSGSADDEQWWAEELEAYRSIGLTTSFAQRSSGEAGFDLRQESELRAALELPANEAVAAAAPVGLVVPADTPRARHWARLYALRFNAETGRPVTLLDAEAESGATLDLSQVVAPGMVDESIPRCPGPFGGTTVLVLPEDVSEADKKLWIAVEENDPLNKQSRFHRVRIAVASDDAGDRSLPSMLKTLESQGRKNILMVPASFYAAPAMMRRMEQLTVDAADRMTLRWMPGLGGEELPVGLAVAEAPVGVVGHSLRVALHPETSRIEVEDTILLPPGLRSTGTEFVLNSALTISSSEPALRNLGAAESEGGPGRIRYALEEDASDGELRLRYAGAINFGIADEKEQYSRGIRESQGVLSSEGVYLHAGTGWVPKFADEMIRFDLEVEAPADWHVISQGNGSSDAEGASGSTRLARWDSGAEMEQVYLVGGPLTVQREMAGAVEALVYLHERDEALSRKYLDATARYIEMYRKLIGPYPYEKFALVENFWETGYGMPSFTLLGEQVIRLPFILHSSYPHEILHNWWGNSVFVDYESGNWCEGLTAYMADHLIQEQRGLGSTYRRNTLQKYRSFVKDGRDFPLHEFRSRHSAATEAVGYGKSLMLFHMLRRDVGDEAFRRIMTDFYRKNRGERAGFDDIRASAESVTGEDLSSFFAQWVDRMGAPSLSLRDVGFTGSQADGGYTVSGVLVQSQSGAPYRLSVPVVLATEGGQESHVLAVEQSEQRFSIEVGSMPRAIAVDPSFDLFRLLDPFEMPSSIGQIFGEPRVLAVLPAAEEDGAYRALLEAWRTDDHQIEFKLDSEIDALPADRGVWVLGRTNRFASEVFGSDDAVELGGEAVGLDGNCVVVIRRNPGNPEKAVGWIAVSPSEAFEGFGRKLPHYGKYSYLAFEGDEPTNFVKGQWETPDSPLVHAFEQGAAGSIEPEQRAALAELPPVFSQRTLAEHVDWLAAPERMGRGLGSPELDQSAAYIAEQFESAGLSPGGDDGTWFQRFVVAEGPEGEPVEAMNVIGVLPGSRSDWSEQSVVVGAHYDHVGLGWPEALRGNAGKAHPGADDNASGVSVLIELARNFASEGGGSRNLVFVAFSGEESGLHGSKHYVENPSFPVAGMRGMVNMDTVGRLFDGEISVHATGTADEWQHIFRGVGFVTGIRSKNIPARVGGSDQESFIDAGVPAVQIFTGAHEDYHRPTDTPDKIDSAGLVKVATFVKEAVAYLIEREPPMNVRIEGAAPAGGEQANAGGRRVSFGTVPSFGFAGPGVKVDSLVPDSPAQRAGVQAGDILIRIDDESIDDLRAFSALLKTLAPGQEVTAVVVRDGVEVAVPVRVEAR